MCTNCQINRVILCELTEHIKSTSIRTEISHIEAIKRYLI